MLSFTTMDADVFERIAFEELAHVPPRFARRIENVAVLIEDEPSQEVCKEEGLGSEETLLGLYRGIHATGRGEGYSGVIPDTITLYRLPLLEEEQTLVEEGQVPEILQGVRLAIRETLWHELGHHFGLGEEAVHAREEAQTNRFDSMRETLRRAEHGIPMKRFAIIIGTIFVLLGLAGFVSNPLVGLGAVFATNSATNWLHLIFGMALVLLGIYAKRD